MNELLPYPDRLFPPAADAPLRAALARLGTSLAGMGARKTLGEFGCTPIDAV